MQQIHHFFTGIAERIDSKAQSIYYLTEKLFLMKSVI
jgi:hypothetical protein